MQVEHKRKVARNTALFFGSRVIDIIGVVIVNVVIARYLGVVNFGEYSFMVAFVVSIMTISYFGLDRIVVRDITHNLNRAAEYVGSVILVRWMLSIFATGLVFVILPFMDVAPDLRMALVAIVASEFIGASASIVLAVFRGYERMEYEVYVTIFSRLVTLVFVVTAVLLDLGILGICLAMLAASIPRVGLSLWLLRRKFVVPVFNFDWSWIKKIAVDAVVLGGSVLLSSCFFRLAQMTIKFINGPEQVAYFQVAHAIFLQVTMIGLSVGTAILPLISRLATDSVKDRAEVARLYGHIAKMLVGIALAVAAALICFSKEIIGLLFGAEFMLGLHTMNVLFIAIVPFFLHSINTFIFIGYNKQRYLIVIWATTLTVSFVLYLQVIPLYGSLGAAAAYVVSILILVSLQIYFMTKKIHSGLHFPIPLLLINTLLVFGCALVSMQDPRFLTRLAVFIVVVLFAALQLKEYMKKGGRAFMRPKKGRRGQPA